MNDKPKPSWIDVMKMLMPDFPTASLIAELEKRRPCEKCVDSFMEKRSGCTCIWQDPFYYDKDNFKPAK